MPSELVRRTAGTILGILARGPATVFDIERETLQDNRTCCRAIQEIRTWDVGLVIDRPRTDVRGSNPMVYSLDDPGKAVMAFDSMKAGPFKVSALVAIGLAIETGGRRGV